MSTPLILEIKGNSLDDGPGIRSVIFFKGCPLDCVWCHNPESKKREAEISFDARQCIGCSSCMDTCRNSALSRENRYFVDREACSLCFKCEDGCPSGAMSRVGRSMAVEEIVSKVLKDKPFFDTSGGGVTLSGGEPTTDMAFTSELMQALKEQGVHVLIETCGLFNINRFMEQVYPYADTIYFDIKLMDPDQHTLHCGVSNEVILKNFVHLNDAYKNGGVGILPRTPLIPGITDTEENITAISELYTDNGVKRAALLNYNPLWHEKNHKIGNDNPLSREDRMATWLSKEKELFCRKILTRAGVDLV